MSMLQQWATGTNAQTTDGEYDYELPNSEPTDTRTTQKGGQHYDKPYTNWKAKNYTTSGRIHKGGSSGKAVNEVCNNWYNVYAMLRFRKILKRYSKYNATNMAA